MGCAISAGNPPYPAEWASIRSKPTREGCPDLQGTYSSRGDATFPPAAGAAPSLAVVFQTMAKSQAITGPAAWQRTWPAIPDDAVSVSIEQTADALNLTFVDPAGRATPLPFRRYHFSLSEDRVDDLYACRSLYDEPYLKFFNEPLSHYSYGIVVMGGGGTAVYLLRSVDGSLVVNWRSDAAVLSLLIVGTGYRVDNIWYRYPALPARQER